MNLERERKFVCPTDQARLLVSPTADMVEIHQWYLSPQGSGDELRIRRLIADGATQFIATLKQGSGLDRLETEVPIAEAAAQELRSLAYAELQKTRYSLGKAGLTLDFFEQGELGPYAMIEAEQYPGSPDIRHLTPHFLGEPELTEITNNLSFYCRQLATEVREDRQDMITPEAFSQLIAKKLRSRTTPLIVTIGGPSGSGKTTVIEALKRQFPHSAVINTDDYYIGKTRMHAELPPDIQDNFDHPSAIDTEALRRDIFRLRSGESIASPVYDMLTSEPLPETRQVAAADLIIVEGLIANHPSLRNAADMSASLHTPLSTRLARRIERDRTRKGYTPETTMDYFMNVAEPAYLAYYAQGDEHADYQIDNRG